MANDPLPELPMGRFEEMMAELDAMCRQSRELSTEITRRMAEQKEQDRPVSGRVRFHRPVPRPRRP